MIGLFVHARRDETPPAAVAEGRFTRYPWIASSRATAPGFRAASYHHAPGVNAAGVHEDDARIVLLQGYFFVGDETVTEASAAVRHLDADVVPEGISSGAFNLVVHDRSAGTTRLVRDRFSLMPLFASTDGELILSTRLDAVRDAADRDVARDPAGVLDRLVLGFHPAHATILDGVRVLPSALDITFSSDGTVLAETTYWRPRFRPDAYPDRAARADALAQAISRAMARLNGLTDRPPAILLSGGLDSRALYGFSGQRVKTFTFGPPDITETRYARRVVEAAGKSVEHMEIEFTPAIVKAHFDEAVGLTEGIVPMVSPALPHVGRVLRDHDVGLVHEGYLGDLLFAGSFISKPESRPKAVVDDLVRGGRATPWTDASRERLRDGMATWFLSETPAAIRTTLGVTAEEHARARADLLVAETLDRYGPFRHEEDLVDLAHVLLGRGARSARYGTLQLQHFVDVSLPLMDYEVFDAYLALPPRDRSWGRVYRMVFARHLAALARVPSTSTVNRPVRAPHREVVIRRYVRRALWRFGRSERSYIDVPGWMAEDAELRKLVAAHAGGTHDHGTSLRLGAAGVTLEAARALTSG